MKHIKEYEEFINEKFDADYWEDYHNGTEADKIKITSMLAIQHDVEGAVEDWNDNNEMGKENEITPAIEKKVIKLVKDFYKAKGWYSFDIIDAMLAQES